MSPNPLFLAVWFCVTCNSWLVLRIDKERTYVRKSNGELGLLTQSHGSRQRGACGSRSALGW